MRRIQFALLTAVTVFGFASTASAADMPVKARYNAPAAAPAYNWTGFYLGLNGGYGWGQTTGNFLPTYITGNHDISGGLVGGQVGFNYQLPASPLVLGIEADWDWADIKGSQSGTAVFVLSPGGDSVKAEDLGTVRGRAGYAWDRFLIYGTGGWAWSHRVSSTFWPSAVSTSNSHSLNGYTVGGGIEYGFTPNLSLKVEYLYAHLLPTSFFQNAGCPSGPQPLSSCSLGANVNVVRLGLNWRFNGLP